MAPPDELEQVLGRTLGVPLFQEQAMKIAIVAASSPPARPISLRRAMATFKRVGTIGTFQDKMVEGMAARGYDRDFAERCFHQIEGFGEYGFPESHAASFALLVYASAWIKCHYPDVFCAALLNSQPMGFYAPAQIVRDATRHGIAVLPVDVNFSDWDSTLEADALKTTPSAGAPLPPPDQVGGRLSPFQGEETQIAPVEQHRHRASIANAPTPPPPERGRLGGGQHPTNAPTRFDHTPSKTERARKLRREATSPERILWSKLRSAQIEGASFQRQHPIGPYVLDFYCPALGLVIELDGGLHGHEDRVAADRRRDAWLTQRGLKVIRFWNDEVRKNLQGILDKIRLAILAARTNPPSRLRPAIDPFPAPDQVGVRLSPFPGEGTQEDRWRSSGDAVLAERMQPAPPPPERGRLGGGQHPTSAPTRFDHTPAETERARDEVRTNLQGGDPLPSSPFQGEGTRGQRRSFHPDAGYAQPAQPAPPPPERGRLGGGQHPTDAPTCFDYTPAETERARDEVRTNLQGGDPLPSSPFQGEETQIAPVEQHRDRASIANGPPNAPTHFDHTPAETEHARDKVRTNLQGGDPLPSSPFQGEGTQIAPAEQHRHRASIANSPPTPPPPERGRLGGGQSPLTETLPRQSIEPVAPDPPRLHPANADMAGDIRSTHVVRLGFRQIKGFREEDAEALVGARGRGYDSVRDLWLRSGLSRAAIERLADADGFRSLGLDRRDALWAARELGGGKADDRLPLFDVAALADIRREPDFALPPMPIGEHVVNDYRYLSLSLKAHPLAFLRAGLAARRIVPNNSLRETPNGRRVTVSGLAIVRQRPGTASGVIFMTIEDETDIANIVVWPKMFEKYRPVVLGARLVAVTGRVQSESGVIHVIADKLEDLTAMLAVLSAEPPDPRLSPEEAIDPRARADEVRRPGQDHRERAEARAGIRHPRNVRFFDKDPAPVDAVRATGKVMPKGRNFH